MGIWSRLKSAVSGMAKPEAWLLQALGGGPTTTGLTVTPANALTCSAVLACVRVISEDVAKLDLKLWRRRKDGGREEATDHPLYRVLASKPNSWQSRFEFVEMGQGHLCLRGNGYSYVKRNERGQVLELVPLHPDRVTLHEAPDGELFYGVSPGTMFERAQLQGESLMIPSDRMLHIRGLSSDGLRGMSVISLAREAVGLALAMEQHGGRTFSNAARPGGVLKHPGKIGPEVAARIKASWAEAYSGLNNVGKTPLLEEGMEWIQLGMTNVDAQYLAGRVHQAEDIARIFRVPQHKIGLLGRSTNNNIEHQALEYTTDCLMPWLERWEAAMDRQLLTDVERETYYFEFDTSALLRGDLKSRYDAYAVGRQWGWLSKNDVRRKEGMNPIPDGDDYLTPLNMIPNGAEPKKPAPKPAAAPTEEEPPEGETE
jgi:HK97 family phage portal protein